VKHRKSTTGHFSSSYRAPAEFRLTYLYHCPNDLWSVHTTKTGGSQKLMLVFPIPHTEDSRESSHRPFLSSPFFHSLYQTDLCGVHGRDRQHFVAKQKTYDIVSDLAELHVVPRSSGKRHAEGDGQKDGRAKIHGRLVGH